MYQQFKKGFFMKILKNKKLKTLHKVKNFAFIFFLTISLVNIQPLVAMNHPDDDRGELIKYLKTNHPETFNKLNILEVEEKPTNSPILNWCYSWLVNPKRLVNSEDILFPAIRAWSLGMTEHLFKYAENAIYNIALYHSKNVAKGAVDIFLKSEMSKEKLFTHLLAPNQLNNLLIGSLLMNDFKENKPCNSNDLPLWFKGVLNVAKWWEGKYAEDHMLWIKEQASSFTEECLIGPLHENFSLKTMKEDTLIKVNQKIIELMKKDQEVDDKNFLLLDPIVSPLFKKKGREASRLLMLTLMEPLAVKLGMTGEFLIKEKRIPDSKKGEVWDKKVKKITNAYDKVSPNKTCQVFDKQNKYAYTLYDYGMLYYYTYNNSDKAYKYFIEAANTGDSRAHLTLKELYSHPPVIQQPYYDPPIIQQTYPYQSAIPQSYNPYPYQSVIPQLCDLYPYQSVIPQSYNPYPYQPVIYPSIAPQLSQYFMIISMDTGKALGSESSSFSNIGKHRPRSPGHNNYSHQVWRVTQVDADYSTIVSQACGEALDCKADWKHLVGKHELRPSWRKYYNRQLWKITPVDANYYTIVSQACGKALDSWGDEFPHFSTVGKHTPHFPEHQHYKRHLWQLWPVSM